MPTATTAVLILAAALLAFSCQAADIQPNQKPLAEIKQELKDGKAVLIDVREQNEWNAGHVKDATSLPLSALKSGQADLSKLPKDKTLYTYCVMGKRSVSAALILQEKGYTTNALKEGFKTLSESGFDTAK